MPEKPPLQGRRPTMAAGSWVRSLHCKSTAVEDVVAARGGAAIPVRKLHPLLPRSGCASTGDARKNVAPSKLNKPVPPGSTSALPKRKSGSKPSPPNVAVVTKKPSKKPASVVPPSPPPGPLGPLPALTELPAGHSSRQVVEIIFLSSWSPFPAPPPPPPGAAPTCAFPGEVEMLFRVHNPARAVARFEDYRAAVRARAGGASRSAADGNEMMRFSPAPQPYGSATTAAATGGGEGAVRVRTFDGSGGAHASVGVARGLAASGRRAMFLCRVIAGRVAEGGTTTGSGEDRLTAPGKEHDSVRVGKGELVVFDRRAVLPCFLIIYKL